MYVFDDRCDGCLCCMSLLGVIPVGFYCFFQAEDSIRNLVRSRGLGDVYKRQKVPVRSCRKCPVSRKRLAWGGMTVGGANIGPLSGLSLIHI